MDGVAPEVTTVRFAVRRRLEHFEPVRFAREVLGDASRVVRVEALGSEGMRRAASISQHLHAQ